ARRSRRARRWRGGTTRDPPHPRMVRPGRRFAPEPGPRLEAAAAASRGDRSPDRSHGSCRYPRNRPLPCRGSTVATKPVGTDLDLDAIQGNVVPGFSKDHQAFVFVRFGDAAAGRAWLAAIQPDIASAREVENFK